MGLLGEALHAFRCRRFVEWLFFNRPQVPVILGLSFYGLFYFQVKYDWISRWKGQQHFDNYSYVKEAAERERARLAARSSSPVPDSPEKLSPSISDSLSSTGVN